MTIYSRPIKWFWLSLMRNFIEIGRKISFIPQS